MKIWSVVKKVVYYSTLIGPVLNTLVDCVKAFKSEFQAICEEKQLEIERNAFFNPSTETIDLSHTPEAQSFSTLCEQLNKYEEK